MGLLFPYQRTTACLILLSHTRNSNTPSTCQFKNKGMFFFLTTSTLDLI